MEGKLKIAVRILFLIALIWFLAAVSGHAPGVRIRVGKGNCRGGHRRRKGYTWTSSGMYGQMSPSPANSFSPVGQSTLLF